MKQLLDFSAARPAGKTIKENGYDGVIRYLSYSAWKNLTASEVKDYLANGLEIGVVWETTANRCLSGFSGGKADATEALKQSKALLPSIIPIYFAVDFNIAENQLSTLDEYLNGAESVIGKDLVGVYGSYRVIEHCFAKNSAKWFWQTMAWSGGKVSARNHIYQDGRTPLIKDTDTNVAVDNWGYQPIIDEVYPSSIIDLKNWKITLPTGVEVKQLDNFIDKKYFYTDGNLGVVFKAPVNGSTTPNSGYPRSELREMNGASLASWSTQDKKSMYIDQAITAIPIEKKHVVAGQIHDKDDDVIVIRLEFPKLFIDINGNDGPTLDPDYNLGKRFNVEFRTGDKKIEVYYNGQLKHTLNKDISGCYFKAGCYTQSNCSKETECSENNYGEVVIYKLEVDKIVIPTPIPEPEPEPIPEPIPVPIPSPTPATRGKVISRRQGDPRWGNVKMGQSDVTLTKGGCLVNIISDALYWLGIDLLPDYLAKNLRFTYNVPGLADGLFYWNSLDEKTRAKFVTRNRVFNKTEIDYSLLKHPTRCVFLEFNFAGARHWCFALSKDWAGRYKIADPLRGDFTVHTRYGPIVGYAIIDLKS